MEELKKDDGKAEKLFFYAVDVRDSKSVYKRLKVEFREILEKSNKLVKSINNEIIMLKEYLAV